VLWRTNHCSGMKQIFLIGCEQEGEGMYTIASASGWHCRKNLWCNKFFLLYLKKCIMIVFMFSSLCVYQ